MLCAGTVPDPKPQGFKRHPGDRDEGRAPGAGSPWKIQAHKFLYKHA